MSDKLIDKRELRYINKNQQRKSFKYLHKCSTVHCCGIVTVSLLSVKSHSSSNI